MIDAPLLEVRGDRLYWRGIYKDEAECAAILRTFQAKAADPTDYYRHLAREMAKRLEKAMRHAGYIKESELA